MQHIPTSTEAAGRHVDSVVSHLSDPVLGGVPGDATESDPAGLELKKEQDVICDEAAPAQNLDGEEIGAGKDCDVRRDEIPPGRAWAPLRGRCDTVALQNVSDRLIRNVVAEVGQRARDPIIPSE